MHIAVRITVGQVENHRFHTLLRNDYELFIVKLSALSDGVNWFDLDKLASEEHFLEGNSLLFIAKMMQKKRCYSLLSISARIPKFFQIIIFCNLKYWIGFLRIFLLCKQYVFLNR